MAIENRNVDLLPLWIRSNSSNNSSNGNGYNVSDHSMVTSSIYIIFAILGLIGNGAVIAVILKVLSSRRMVINVYLYVLCLSAVDFLFLATSTMTIAFMINHSWKLGQMLCKVAYFGESLNKTASVYLLVILSADRYLAVCKPTSSARYRSVKAALIALIALFICILITNTPIYMYVQVSVGYDQISYCGMVFPKLNVNRSDGDPWNHVGSYYTIFLAVFYHVIPAILICLFYIQILSRLREQYRCLRKRSSSRRRKTTMSILTVIAFYFICWTPYWLLQIVSQFLVPAFGDDEAMDHGATETLTYISECVYMLPYFNAGVNPILYAFLNKRLRKAYAASSKRTTRHKYDRTNVETSVDDRFEHRVSRLLITAQAGGRSVSPLPRSNSQHERVFDDDGDIISTRQATPDIVQTAENHKNCYLSNSPTAPLLYTNCSSAETTPQRTIVFSK